MSATLPHSDVDAGKSGAGIRDRLRSAAAIDPRRLPRLARMAEAWAQAMSERFAAVAVDAPTVSFREIEVDGPPEPDGGNDKGAEGDGFACDMSSGRFVVPGWITLGAQGTELLIATLFGAQPDSDAPLRAASDLDRSLVQSRLRNGCRHGVDYLCTARSARSDPRRSDLAVSPVRLRGG